MTWKDFVVWLKQHKVGHASLNLSIYAIHDGEIQALLEKEQEVLVGQESR